MHGYFNNLPCQRLHFNRKIDYYFAGLTVLTQFHALGARYFNLYKHSRVVYRWLFSLACILAYVYHVHRLYTDWSYTYNMQANICVGLLQNVFYCLVCLGYMSNIIIWNRLKIK